MDRNSNAAETANIWPVRRSEIVAVILNTPWREEKSPATKPGFFSERALVKCLDDEVAAADQNRDTHQNRHKKDWHRCSPLLISVGEQLTKRIGVAACLSFP